MQYQEDLPCGGFADEDKIIKEQILSISIGKDSQRKCDLKKCQKEVCQCIKLKHQQSETENQQNLEKNINKSSKQCKKCRKASGVLLQKGEPVCKQCLLRNIEYKCRLYLENGVKVTKESNLLVCISGGLNSICLAKILSNIKKRYQKNKLFKSLKFIHIKQQQNIKQDVLKSFFKQIDEQITIINIEQIFEEKKADKTLNDVKDIFLGFSKAANTADLLEIFRNRLILKFAQTNKMNLILKGSNGEALAIENFKYFTKGIGGNIPGLCSSLEEGQFIYPLRQHLQKQLQYYYHILKLHPMMIKMQEDDIFFTQSTPIDSHIKHFIESLQNIYSHTAPAIVRTSQKIQSNRKNQKECKWCFLKGIADQKNSLCRRCMRIWEYKSNDLKQDQIPTWMSNNIQLES